MQALAHRSWCAEQATATEPPPPSNERLEYLGDAVLGAIVADHVYQQYPQLLEGRLTDARKAVVNAVALAERRVEAAASARRCCSAGRETSAGGREKTSILADALEAVIARRVPRRWMASRRATSCSREIGADIAASVAGLGALDYKSLLQELAGRRGLGAPRYEIDESGPDHAKEFTARVAVGMIVLGEGDGSIEEAGRAGRGAGCVRAAASSPPTDGSRSNA